FTTGLCITAYGDAHSSQQAEKLFHGFTFCFWLLMNVVIYFENYFTKVGTWFNIVHCFVLGGNFQG
ncbi:MAG: hypothetical protein KTQ13_00400, partial [Ferruginibacter sp.]|nr:hypothetical protein [Ferruginibacter sp.]